MSSILFIIIIIIVNFYQAHDHSFYKKIT